MKIKAAILVDNLELSIWQKKTIKKINDVIDVKIILNCQNNNPKKKIYKNFFYYILNFFSIRNKQTKKELLSIKNLKCFSFNTYLEGRYQIIPKKIIEIIHKNKIKIIIKFGMNIIKVDSSYDISFLSFHHGDPEYYRGRPAGFYEILNNERYIGSVVQKISNDLDYGEILIKHKFKINTNSYKKTLENIYEKSPLIMIKAIHNFIKNESIHTKKKGKLYTLPDNYTVIKFIFLLFLNNFSNLFKIIFFQKKWKVSFALKSNININNLSNQISKFELKYINFNLKNYTFISDPFFSKINKNVIRYEAYNKKTNFGEIIEEDIKNKSIKKIFSDEHYSYPISLIYQNEEFIFPEVAFHSPPFLYKMNSNHKFILKGFENLRIVDATLFYHDNIYYLFYGLPKTSLEYLYLSYSTNILGPYSAHPMNPIVVDPTSARMGGNIIVQKNSIYRMGQDNSGYYGNGINLYKILKLDINNYYEVFVNNIKFKTFYGPHTIDFNENKILLDHYENKFNIFSIINKLKTYNRIKKLSS